MAIKVTLGKIAREGIEAHIEVGGDVEAVVRAALRRYAELLDSADPPLLPPPFSAGRKGSGGALELGLDAEMQDLLERQARDGSVTVEELAAHAVLLYLAELDAIDAIAVAPPADT